MKKILKISAICAVVLVIVLAGLYAYLTSEAFIKGQVLPRVSEKIGEPITVDTVALSPFSQIRVGGLQVGKDGNPLATVKDLHVRYKLRPLLDGNLIVDEVLVDGVSARLVQAEDGSLNLPKPTKSDTPAAKKAQGGESPIKFIDVRQVTLRDLAVSFVSSAGGSSRDVQVTDLEVDIPAYTAGQTFNITSSAYLKVKIDDTVDVAVEPVKASISGTVSDAFLPKDVKLNVTLPLKGTTGKVELAGRSLAITADAAMKDTAVTINSLIITHKNGETEEGSVKVVGMASVGESMSANLSVLVATPNANMMNLAGGLINGMSFGNTRLRYEAQLGVSDEKITAKGTMKMDAFTVSLPKNKVDMKTPMKINVAHDVAFAPKSKTVSVTAFSAAVADAAAEQLRLTVDRPFNIALGGGKAEAEPAKVRVVASNLDLSPIGAFVPETVPVAFDKARLSSTLDIDIADAGNQLSISDDTVVTGLAVTVGGTTLENVSVSTKLAAKVADIDKAEIASSSISVKLGDDQLAALRLSGNGSIKEQTGTVTIHENTVDLAKAASLPLKFGDFELADIDLGDTKLSSSSTITVGPKQAFAASGTFSVTNTQFSSKKMKVDKVRPLKIDGSHDVEFNGTTKVLSLRGVDVKIADQGKQALQLTLQEPGKIMLEKGAKTDAPLKLRSQITDLGLSLIKPFVKTDAVDLDYTKVNSDIATEVSLPFNIRAAGTLAASGIKLKDAPKPFAVSTDLDVRHNGKETITLTKLNTELGAVGESTIADAQVSGTVVLPLDKLGTEVNLKTTKMVDIEKLMALLPQAADSADPAKEPEPTKPPTVEPFKPLWAKLNYDLAGAGYGELGLIGVKGTAELAGNAYSLTSKGGLNSGTFDVSAKGDIPSVPDLTYNVTASLTNLDVTPVLETVMPDYAELIKGSVAESSLTVSGKGTNPDTILDALKVNASVTTGKMSIGKSGTGWDTVFTVILLAQHQMGWEDMRFDRGSAELALEDYLLTVRKIDVRGPLLRLKLGGSYHLKSDEMKFLAGLGYEKKSKYAKYGDIDDGSGYMMEESEWVIDSFSRSDILAANVGKAAGLAGADAETQGDIQDGAKAVKVLKDLGSGKKGFFESVLGATEIYNEREKREREREEREDREADKENEANGIKSVPPADFEGSEKKDPPREKTDEEKVIDVIKGLDSFFK